jgi:uncharacterized phage protein (TIGR02216 family)
MDWLALMRAGMRGLGLHPTQFWELTPAELMLMLGQADQDAPLSRSRLEDLSQLFPDVTS